MKGRMWRYFTAKNTNIYYDVLQKLVSDYNNNKHSTIKMSPVHASMARNEKDAWSNLHTGIKPIEKKKTTKPKFKVFDKGYTPN